MNLENVKEIVKYLKSVSYKDLFGALIAYDNMEYLGDEDDIIDGDIDYLEELYEYYMDSDISLTNASELVEEFNEYKKINIY